MRRYIYAFDTPDAARVAVAALRQQGVDEKLISLIARSDIQLEKVPDAFLDASNDFLPALGRGAALGGVTGLFAGLVAMAIPPLGIAMAGSVLLGFFGGGVLVGAWTSALVGASVPNEVRRKFEDEIKAGRTLLVVDAASEDEQVVTKLLMAGTDRHLLWQSEVHSASAAA